MINFPKGIKEANPNLETVTPIKPNTPSGASFIIWLVIQNIASATPWHIASTGFPFSPIAATPKPNITEKKIIGSKSPFERDSKILVGTIFINVSISPWLDAVSAVCIYLSILVVARLLIFTPFPGWTKLATSKPTIIANVVTTSK